MAFDYVVLRPDEAETIRRGVGRKHGKALRDESVISGMWKAFAALGPLEVTSWIPTEFERGRNGTDDPCRRRSRAFPPGLRALPVRL